MAQWKIGYDNDGNGHYSEWLEISSGQSLIAKLPIYNNREEVEANAHRIVVCVNALEGINPEAVRGLLEWAKEALWHLDPGTQQGRTIHRTDELVKGLETAVAKAEAK